MGKRKSLVYLFRIIASLLMVFSLIGSGITNAEARDKQLHPYLNDSQSVAKAKVSDRLLDEFKETDKVTFLIKFEEQAETDKVVEEAKASAKSSNMTTEKAAFLQRSAVISELKATSFESQQNVQQYLDEEEINGNAEVLKSYFIVNGMAVTATKDVAQKIATFAEVEKILPNETRQLITPELAEEAKSNDKDIEWNVERIHAPEVWDMEIDGTGVVVASIDSGVQWDHPALKEKYRGYDAKTGEVDHDFNWYDPITDHAEPYDDVGHGTHVTGTMVGSEPDGSNQIGIAPGAEWISVKAFSEDGGSDADLLGAAEWILAPTDKDGNTRIDLAPDIVNNSWSGGPGLDEWYRDVVKEWRNAEIFPAFAAGNVDMFNPGGPGSIANPANYPESFAIGATDSDDLIGEFSLLGPSPYDEIKPDISAPGVDIRSSIPGGEYEGGWNGTSMAGPAVSAVVALLYQVDSSLSVADTEAILLETAVPLTDEAYAESPNNGYGHGLVDANKAVLSITDGLGTLEGEVVRQEDNAPVSGQVSILENGRSVRTNPEDGSFKLSHGIGEFTAQAETYGYQSDEQFVTINKDETTQADFKLEALPKATLSGLVTNEITGEAVEGVALSLVEDANVKTVETDKKGNYDITAYEGTYTLKLSGKGYHSKEVEVTFEADNEAVNVTLDPFFTYPGGEIGYDNGEVTNGSMYYGSGAGWAVKMSLPDNKESAIVTEGLFHFIDKGFSDERGTEFAVEVWDASGPDGQPGNKLAGPISAEAVYDEWTTIDLADQQIKVDGDFYMVYIQTMEYPTAPGLGTDDGNPYSERSYQYQDGKFYPAFEEDGNYMIRSSVNYEIEDPIIVSPEEGDTLNEASITVKGDASPSTTLQLMNNGEKVGETEIDDDGVFEIPITLSQGENVLKAMSMVEGVPAGESESIEVTLDADATKVTIDNPKDGDKINRETITVEGTVNHTNLDYVEVNGQKATVTDDGQYAKRIMLANGENEIEVTAKYNDGKEITESVTIQVKYRAPIIENIAPTEDIYVDTGETAKFEFDSEPGLKATFFIHMPLTNTLSKVANVTELPMMETSDGHYVGYWTVPSGVKANGAVIEVKGVDSFKNETREEVKGKLFINKDE